MIAVDPPPRLFRNHDYLFLVAGQGVSVLGAQIVSVALPLLALDLTRSPAQAGLVAALAAAPYLVLSLVAGALVDRWNRRTVLVACNVVRAAVFLWVPLGYALGVLDLLQLCVLALVSGTAFVFFTITELAVLPQLVPHPQLARAGSVNAVAESTAGLVGPGLGGTLVGAGRTPLAGGALAFLVAGGAYAVSALSLLLIRRPLRGTGARGAPVRREVAAGLRFLWECQEIRRIALTSAALNLLFSPAQLAIIVHAQELRASPAEVGLIFSVGGAAGIAGGLLAPRLTRRVPVGRALAGAVVVWALAMPLLPAATALWALVAAWAVVTFVSPVYDVTQLAYRLALIPAELQGRVNSTFRFIAWGLRPIAVGVGGLALGAVGARPTLWALACGMAVLASVTIIGRIREITE
jgi:MFS family permease